MVDGDRGRTIVGSDAWRERGQGSRCRIDGKDRDFIRPKVCHVGELSRWVHGNGGRNLASRSCAEQPESSEVIRCIDRDVAGICVGNVCESARRMEAERDR